MLIPTSTIRKLIRCYILVVRANSNLIALDLSLLFLISNDIVKIHAYVK